MEELEYFEIDNKILDDFDNLMKMHLDKVKYLKIGKNIKNDKFYNIIGLCFNINTLEIDSDIKLDVNKVFASICKPNLLQNINLKNTKLPTGKFLNKFDNIKKIEMSKIKFSDVKDFFLSLNSQKTIEEISMEEVDFSNNDLEFFKSFKNLKILKLINMTKIKLEKMQYLAELKKLKEITLKGNKTKISEISGIVKAKCKKDIQLKLNIQSNYLKIKDEQIEIKINIGNLLNLKQNIDFSLINNLEIVLDEKVDLEEFTKDLKNVKSEIKIYLTDLSNLTVEQIQLLKEELNIKQIYLIDFKDKNKFDYDIETFLEMRQAIDKFINLVPKELSCEEKVLWIYKVLLQNIEYYEEKQTESNDEFKQGLIENKCISKGYAQILKNCLECLEYNVNLVYGIYKKEKKDWFWVQVQINEEWYNLDLALDAKQNKKMKYCLINNEKISKDYDIKSEIMYCIKNYDYKLITQFLKKYKKMNEKKNAIKKLIEKIKILFMFNKKLPEGNNELPEGEKVEKNLKKGDEI